MYQFNFKNSIWKFIKKISNLNFALSVLFIVIIFCIIGSVLEQEQELIYYLNNYSQYSSLILFFGLDHVFRTPCFIISLAFLLTSLISCSFTNQLPSLKNSRRWKFIYQQNSISPSMYMFTTGHNVGYSYINTAYSLLRMDFFIFCRKSSVYAYKGLFGRVAPIFVHLSIIIILLGSVYGSSCSYVLQEKVPIGEVFHFKNIVYSGFCSSIKKDLFGRIDDFYINYYENGSVKQFFSSISVYMSNDKLDYNGLMYVNHPLHFYNITVYQTNWEINSLRFRLGDSYLLQRKVFKKLNNNQVLWVSNLSISENSDIFFVLDSLNDSISIFNQFGSLVQKINVGQKFYLNSTPCIIESVIPSTGLQLKFDPGLFLVYIGFFIMIISTFISYISYSQVWVYPNMDSLEFFGSTNRAKFFFEQDIKLINKIYLYYLTSISFLSTKLTILLR
uniref:Cytochrome c biogenesis protein Ccs1 n=1 Tax=Polysiphonia sertularioides TaxID=945028 RepID=A0A1Z1M8W0_9FLOR|nr:cytochrome c biogenesis protein ccs1 [Polysiphonia sertularioides]ARW62416.1 cytochrome c biogenesis protein ccs1 [Polysiphonia sertularioides]